MRQETEGAEADVATVNDPIDAAADPAAGSAWAGYWASLKDCLQREQAFTELPDVPDSSIPPVIFRAVAAVVEQVVHVAVLDSEMPKLQVYPMLPGN